MFFNHQDPRWQQWLMQALQFLADPINAQNIGIPHPPQGAPPPPMQHMPQQAIENQYGYGVNLMHSMPRALFGPPVNRPLPPTPPYSPILPPVVLGDPYAKTPIRKPYAKTPIKKHPGTE